ncbi:hypothetical protein H0H93_001010 [Arthromyces matolae]|nr:hypothetical protein H0H93_001010 [Arthromyces matolae]
MFLFSAQCAPDLLGRRKISRDRILYYRPTVDTYIGELASISWSESAVMRWSSQKKLELDARIKHAKLCETWNPPYWGFQQSSDINFLIIPILILLLAFIWREKITDLFAPSPPIFLHFKEQAKDAVYALTSCLCQQSAKVKINGRTFQIMKVLGEGGFSFVYLAQDEHSGRQFALKKIRCPTGSEGVKEAMREVEAYRRFKHPNIIRILDSAVVQDPEGDGKIVYLFLPLYKTSFIDLNLQRGNLQDAINANVVNRKHFSEKDMLRLFKGTCLAIRAMHDFHARPGTSSHAQANGSRHPQPVPQGRHSDDDDRFPNPEGDAEGGFSYESGVNVPLVTKHRVEEEGDTIFDGDEELAQAQQGDGELIPYAHRDIKPGNVMIADDGITPILMDFGSACKARIPIEHRSQALLQQDIAAEQSTMAYRAPELFDVKTGTTLDESVDIWNTQTTEQGGSIAMAVLNAQYKHPSSAYSQGLKNLIDSMLKLNPAERPNIHEAWIIMLR